MYKGVLNMICPHCGEKIIELLIFEHHIKCPHCNYEEKDIFVLNDGDKNKQHLNRKN